LVERAGEIGRRDRRFPGGIETIGRPLDIRLAPSPAFGGSGGRIYGLAVGAD